jgi:hypothetical protein
MRGISRIIGRTKLAGILLISLLMIFGIYIIIINRSGESDIQRYFDLIKKANPNLLLKQGYSLNEIMGNIIYLQFIRARHLSDIELANNVLTHWEKTKLKIVLLFENANDINKINIDVGRFLPINESLLSIDQFTRGGVEDFFIFDKTGKLFSKGRSDFGYDDGPKVALKRLVNDEYFSLDLMLKRGDNIFKNEEWSQIGDFIKILKKEYYIVCLFNSICGGCFSGEIIRYFDKISANNNPIVFVVCILNNQYFSNNDILALKSQMNILMPIYLSSKLLSTKWNKLITDYRASELNNIIVIIDKYGEILRVYNEQCNCLKQMSEYVEEISTIVGRK